MRVYKRVSYVQIDSGWQTYIHPVNGEFIRFKLIETPDELETAIARCKQAGWQIVNATNLVKKMNSVCRKC